MKTEIGRNFWLKTNEIAGSGELGSKQGCQMVFFSDRKSQFWFIFVGLGMKNLGTYILWPFGIYCSHFVHLMALGLFSGNFVYFPSFWYIVSRTIWQPWFQAVSEKK
jgi:hypothetical protein